MTAARISGGHTGLWRTSKQGSDLRKTRTAVRSRANSCTDLLCARESVLRDGFAERATAYTETRADYGSQVRLGSRQAACKQRRTRGFIQLPLFEQASQPISIRQIGSP